MIIDSQNLYLVRDSSKDAGKSDSGATIINMSRANYKNAIYMDRLNKRMGEMRYVNGEEEQAYGYACAMTVSGKAATSAA